MWFCSCSLILIFTTVSTCTNTLSRMKRTFTWTPHSFSCRFERCQGKHYDTDMNFFHCIWTLLAIPRTVASTLHNCSPTQLMSLPILSCHRFLFIPAAHHWGMHTFLHWLKPIHLEKLYWFRLSVQLSSYFGELGSRHTYIYTHPLVCGPLLWMKQVILKSKIVF